MQNPLSSSGCVSVDANIDSHSWRQALGLRIRQAREEANLTQEALGTAAGVTRNMIGKYEAGAAVPSVDKLGRIASQLGSIEVRVNGHKFVVAPQPEPATADSKEQFKLDFDRETVYTGATLKITPTKLTLTITAFAPRPARAPEQGDKERAS